MASTLFVSDLHLSPSRPALTRAFGEFLRARARCRALYILGDLFDVWVGDDDDAPLAREVTALLRGFSGQGPALYLMRGNRDFLLGDRFCGAVGATLLPDEAVIELAGEPTLLLHGDTLCTADIRYQQFRRRVHDPAWQAELLARPLPERRAQAAELRRMSREETAAKPEPIMDVTGSAVREALERHGVRQLIHGHTHQPARHEADGNVRWVLGDWGSRAWYIEATETDINLLNYYIY